MTKHTKGPWIVSFVEDHPNDLMVGGDDGSDVVCAIRRKNKLANATLIAAAPELLEMLKTLSSLIRLDQVKLAKPIAKQLQALIAKAEGGVK